MRVSLSHRLVVPAQVALLVLKHHLGREVLVEQMDVKDREQDWACQVEMKIGEKKFLVEVGYEVDRDYEYPVKLSEDGKYVRCYFFFHHDAHDIIAGKDGVPMEEYFG